MYVVGSDTNVYTKKRKDREEEKSTKEITIIDVVGSRLLGTS